MARPSFMIDIETSGVDLESDQILQIAVVAVKLGKSGFWTPLGEFNFYQNFPEDPSNDFAKKHMVDVYARCNKADYVPPDQVRLQLLEFFEKHHGICPVQLLGWNAGGFDMPFLVRDGYLNPTRYEKVDGEFDLVGDFHYRIYDIGSVLQFVRDQVGVPRDVMTDVAEKIYPELPLPDGQKHDALYDCYRQIRLLNGLIRYTK